ncbi:hypothetical protein BDW74DRAFT_190035 [Aspergillus multicolor]|uniref:cytochrome P450 n=1 Tax=Aspergillus multicolor TaxID=41759 RepID=UPI003CCE3C2E
MFDLHKLAFVTVVVVVGYALSRSRRVDPREPPAVSGSIPLISHLIGFCSHGGEYFSILAKKHDHPIFSINLILTRIYIVTSPALLQSMQRNSQTLSLDPFITYTTPRHAGIHGESLELLREKRTGGQGLNQTVMHAMRQTLTGKSLHVMNQRMAALLTPFVDELLHSGGEVVDLYDWVIRAVIAASTDASYGPLNPYKDRRVVDAFRTLDSHLLLTYLDFLPAFIRRKPTKARETLAAALLKYFRANGHTQGSELTRVRYETLVRGGLALPDIARHEAAMAIGLLSNTAPAAFWVTFNIFSRPELLRQIRDEVQRSALRFREDETHVIDLQSLKSACPLLLSTYQESLRGSSAFATRVATADTVLGGRYLVRGGCLVGAPSGAMGAHADVWGVGLGSSSPSPSPSADGDDEFDPRRFIKTPGYNPRRTGGLMTFGVSPILCPGRHFATAEILALVAMLVLRVDIEPVGTDGSRRWVKPKTNGMATASITGPVQGGFHVRVWDREGYNCVPPLDRYGYSEYA